MISVSEAHQIIQANIPVLAPTQLSLHDAAGFVLAEDCFATADIPAFPQSAMDGYAFAFDGWQNKPLQIQDVIPAGHAEKIQLKPGYAARIFTGAAVPDGADTVVMQEKIRTENSTLIIEDDALEINANVRPEGSEIRKGALALPSGTVLTPGAIGFLAGMGISKVAVYTPPRVCIIVTGNELQQPGNPLQFGQVYESNSYSLTAALQLANIKPVSVAHAADDMDALQHALEQALAQCDVLLITGGVSVGDYDFVSKTLEQCGVEKLFHRIRQKPGKPLLFGRKGDQLIFGLPGNPSSVLTCFYEYTWPALEKIMRRPASKIITTTTILAKDYTKKPGLTHFLKGHFTGTNVMPLDAQESYRMSSFAIANCFIVLNEADEQLKKGDTVTIHILPNV